ncbi:MAG: hypothetical protein K9M98_11660 [Cephaloticoccus sp.]|nr:hypothetical protein [Cephaloticoccus sp.]
MDNDLKIATATVAELKQKVERISNCAIRYESIPANTDLISTTEIAWKRKRTYHVVKVNEGLGMPEQLHSRAHELYHIILESEARSIGRNQQVVFSNENHLRAVESIAGELGPLSKIYPAMEDLGPVVQRLVEDTVSILYDTPLDIIIEDMLRQKHPDLNSVQKVGEIHALKVNFQSVSDPVAEQLLPPKILNIQRQLHASYALSAEHRWNGEINVIGPYNSYGVMQLAEQLFESWKIREISRAPGDEYVLIMDFAVQLGMDGWFTLQDDPT